MKKMYKSLCLLTALVLLAACNKDAEPNGSAAGGKTNFAVSLPGAPETYAVEDPQSAGAIVPFYNDVTVYLVDAGNNFVGYAWTDAEIKAREKRFEQITEPVQVIVMVNTGVATMPTGPISFSTFQNAVFAISAADQNKAAKTLAAEDSKGNAAGTYGPIQQVTLFGEQGTFTTETPTDGHTLKKAAVELEAMVSRFELGTVKAGTGLDALTVEAVYVNNFFLDAGDASTSVQHFTEGTWPSTFTPAWATDGYDAAVTSNAGTKVYAYQIFALSTSTIPHVIYKVSGTVSAGYKLADGTGDLDTPTAFTDKYITVKGFREGGSLVSGLEINKIYKMGLEDGGIAITPDKITDKPEKNKIDLIVGITVADWTSSNVTPEF